VASAAVRARVLVVDDEPMVCDSLARLLRGEDVTTCASGRRAVELFCGEPAFEVMFCDLTMPGFSGLEVLEQVLQKRRERAARIVFMTGGAFTPEVQQSLAQQGCRWIEKPFDRSDVLRIVREHARAQATAPSPAR
jgi:CheY-like chemotaxis protein